MTHDEYQKALLKKKKKSVQIKGIKPYLNYTINQFDMTKHCGVFILYITSSHGQQPC